MPTPVAAARRCLTTESAAVLDEAVAVARRRGHAQTTSLHMISSLLSLPNSSLREACTRTRSSAYPTRVQLKALELSVSVSLDRLPSSTAAKSDAPPVSNSLMAAVKRSQANQRRQPENFSFYQQQQYSSSSSSSSPSSSAPIVRVELQNLIVSILDDPLVSRVLAEAGFRSVDVKMATLRPGNVLSCTGKYKRAMPPMFLCNLRSENNMRGFSFPFMGCFTGDDDNSRRIGEVMLRDKKRCPLLLGVSATDALQCFLETVRQNKDSGCGLPESLTGLWVECVGDEILKYLNGDCDDGELKLRLERVEREVDEREGVVVDFGDLGAFLIGDGDDPRLKFLVGSLGKLLEVYGRRKVWLIGMATAYEVYFKILKRFPSIEEDWQLGVLPITNSSYNFSMGGGSYPRSSLMESFVPFGGFFSMPPETKSPLSNACHLCNDKYEQEVAAVSNIEKHQSWLQTAEPSLKGTDGRMLLSSQIAALQKKWDGICRQHHHQRAQTDHVPRVLGFQVVKGTKTSNGSCNANSNDSSVDERGSRNASSIVSAHEMQRTSLFKELIISSDVPAKENNHLIKSPNLDSSTVSVDVDDRTSPASISGLGSETEAFVPNLSKWHSRSLMLKDPKLLYRALFDRVGYQEEAISSIVETITQPGEDGGRNVWINVGGGDSLSKKKLGLALAETLYGSLVYVDLSFPEETSSHVDALLDSRITSKYDVTMRASVVDYLVDLLSKKKQCVVFLDNVDRADLVVQSALSRAVRSGRFTDWCGREVHVSNCVFIGATENSSSGDEEDALSARGSAIEIVVRFDMSDDHNKPMIMNKRKLFGRGRSTKRPHKALDLDLNLPADEIRASDSDSEKARAWMESFEREVDLTVEFKDFDFVKVGETILKNVEECVKNVTGCECAVEVEEEAMQQIIGGAYLYGVKSVEKWIDEVVRKGFVEGMGKYSITGRSIVRLIKAVGFGEEQNQGLLPARVIMK